MALPDFNVKGLLPDGVHPATLDDLECRCVAPFPNSETRSKIFENFRNYQTTIAALGIHATQWINGSFVDQSRLDPDDVDAVNFCDYAALNSLQPAIQIRITPLLDGRATTKEVYDTHSFLEVRFPAGHPFEASFERQRRYWRDWFSRPQDYSGPKKLPAPWRGRKGIVQMQVGDATLCPIVSDAI
ncbi:MAG TPA: hypothetical protein VHH73_18940 [Verrucomicrobiae bacterium]|nr:hypothetical protein [Verrucomicrobiae bacterium]